MREHHAQRVALALALLYCKLCDQHETLCEGGKTKTEAKEKKINIIIVKKYRYNILI